MRAGHTNVQERCGWVQECGGCRTAKNTVVRVNDAMYLVIWTRLFLEAQGFKVVDSIVHQDNQSVMLLEHNGKTSSSKKTRHIDI